MHIHTNIPVVLVHVRVSPFDVETTADDQQTEITATYSNKVSIASRLSNTDTHTHSYIHVCQVQLCSLHLKARKSKAVCIHGLCLEEEGRLVSCAHTTACSPGVLATASHPCLHQ